MAVKNKYANYFRYRKYLEIYGSCKNDRVDPCKFGRNLHIEFSRTIVLMVFEFAPFSYGFEAGVWDLIIYIPDHRLSFYFDSFDFISLD